MLEFLHAGGPFMVLLVLTSIVGLTFIIERAMALRWNKIIPPLVETAVESCVNMDDLPMLQRACQHQPSAMSRLMLTATSHLDWPKEENAGAIQTRARHEIASLERGLVVIEIVVGIAPLLGLVGTIHGLITLFGDLGHSNLNDNAALAKGVAIALNTTLMGLLIAIPSLAAWSYFNKKVERLAIEMETICDEFLRRIYRKKDGGTK